MQSSDQTSTVVRLLRGDEITIPTEFREELGIDDNAMVLLTIVDGELRIRPVHFNTNPSEQGSPGLRALYEYFAPVREEILASGITQEELFADIDAAIAEVRAKRRARRQ
ncbi:MAG: AbrB/MazE/SpoVT family DNA-binding domain-containing protein [Chloroflexia bacterium]|nr:AbrB/MazE/SpoVT family DNA-binding domain-containing protein [Chloroflexia bacterium]